MGKIPKAPKELEKLELMKRLYKYAEGKAYWDGSTSKISDEDKTACRTLHTGLCDLMSKSVDPILDNINSGVMETFTAHDSSHGRKVAHVMWHILTPTRRIKLTPPEIALMVCSAYLHDIGMAVSPKERKERLDPKSNLWKRLENYSIEKDLITKLNAEMKNTDLPQTKQDRARRLLTQVEEALLCQDTRERHTDIDTYEDKFRKFQKMHDDDSSIPDFNAMLYYDSYSFRDKLLDICVSHGEGQEFLASEDANSPGRPRFPTDYTISSCTANLLMIAAALRIADILDFDRGRTPKSLFYYLFPTNLAPQDDKSVLEWQKHMAISNWNIEDNAIIFKGQCNSHIIHHAIVQFCDKIKNEIRETLATFNRRKEDIPFSIPKTVYAKIEEKGYSYVPYQFQLDDDRVYKLLMGNAIYDNPLVAVRELVQNAVDACKLRDSIMKKEEEFIEIGNKKRIFVRYEEPTEDSPHPKLIIKDTGTGMDNVIIENYFLNVGRSYYNSAEFNEFRAEFQERGNNLDFAPVSEFGIGFLSCFLLADRLVVETAMWKNMHGDTRKRTLQIDGPSRLIMLNNEKNDGSKCFRGTVITLFLTRGGGEEKKSPPKWVDIKEYLREVCQDLPYRLELEYVSTDGKVSNDIIDPIPYRIELPPEIEDISVRIPVNDEQSGLTGEIVIVNENLYDKRREEKSKKSPFEISEKKDVRYERNSLLRGGFYIGDVPGLSIHFGYGRLMLNWQNEEKSRYPLPNLARSQSSDSSLLAIDATRIWVSYLLDNSDKIPDSIMANSAFVSSGDRFSSAMTFGFYITDNVTLKKLMDKYNLIKLYDLCRWGWLYYLKEYDISEVDLVKWESGDGKSLNISNERSTIYELILSLILPKICRLQMDRARNFYVTPPKKGWRGSLLGCHDFCSSPVEWSCFVEYLDDIAVYFLYMEKHNYSYANSLFQDDVVKSFEKDDIGSLLNILGRLLNAKIFKRAVTLDNSELELLQKAVDTIGHLKIGYEDQSWQIKDFDPKKIKKA